MMKNIFFCIGLGSCLMVIDATAMLNARIKNFSVSRMMDAQDNKGNTPLHLGVFNYGYTDGDLEAKKGVLIALMQGYANPFVENHQKRTPRQEAELLQQKGASGINEAIELLQMWEDAYYADFSSKANEL